MRMWRIRSAGVTGAAGAGAAGWAASETEARRRTGAAARSKGLNMALLKERRFGWQAIRGASAARLGDQRARGLDMEGLDHSALVALGAAGRRLDQPPG